MLTPSLEKTAIVGRVLIFATGVALFALAAKNVFALPMGNAINATFYFAAPCTIALAAFWVALRSQSSVPLLCVIIAPTIIGLLFIGNIGVVVRQELLDQQLSRNRFVPFLERAKEKKLSFDTRSLAQAVIDTRKAISSAVYVSHVESPAALLPEQPLPLAGVSQEVTVFCNESGEYSIYRSDEHGFNNPLGLHSAKAKIVGLGDSYVHGACVPPGSDVISLQRNQYSDSVNLGYSSAGPLWELAVLKEYAADLRPEWVFWFYYEGNDWWNLDRELSNPTLSRYLVPGFTQRLKQRQPEVDTLLRSIVDRALSDGNAERIINWKSVWQREQGRVRKLVHLREAFGLLPILEQTLSPPGDYRTPLVQVLGEAKRTVDAWGGKIVLVYLPEWHTFQGTAGPNISQVRAHVELAAKDVGITFKDMKPILETMRMEEVYPFGLEAHYTAAAYKRIAEALLF